MRVNITVTDDRGNTFEGTAELTKQTAKKPAKSKTPQLVRKSNAVTGPAGALKKLYNAHFFKTYKSIADVMKKLSEEGINYSIQLVSMALFRAKYLTKKGTKGNYQYIQKQPPS
jgi:hypothetical protein